MMQMGSGGGAMAMSSGRCAVRSVDGRLKGCTVAKRFGLSHTTQA